MNSVLKNEYVEISYDDKLKILLIRWKNKELSFEEYQQPFLFGLKLIKEKPIVNFISDIREQSVITLNDRKWLQDVVIPEAIAYGLKRVIIITNINIFKQFYVNNIFRSTKIFGVPFKMFNSIEKATNWLLKSE
jgi:hypothetical protein